MYFFHLKFKGIFHLKKVTKENNEKIVNSQKKPRTSLIFSYCLSQANTCTQRKTILIKNEKRKMSFIRKRFIFNGSLSEQ